MPGLPEIVLSYDWKQIAALRRRNFLHGSRLLNELRSRVGGFHPAWPELSPDDVPQTLPVYISGNSRDALRRDECGWFRRGRSIPHADSLDRAGVRNLALSRRAHTQPARPPGHVPPSRGGARRTLRRLHQRRGRARIVIVDVERDRQEWLQAWERSGRELFARYVMLLHLPIDHTAEAVRDALARWKSFPAPQLIQVAHEVPRPLPVTRMVQLLREELENVGTLFFRLPPNVRCSRICPALITDIPRQ